MYSMVDTSSNNPFHTAVLCGRVGAFLAMSRPIEVLWRCRQFYVVPVVSLPHPSFNHQNSREQMPVHLVAQLCSCHFISSVLQVLIVGVGA